MFIQKLRKIEKKEGKVCQKKITKNKKARKKGIKKKQRREVDKLCNPINAMLELGGHTKTSRNMFVPKNLISILIKLLKTLGEKN